VPVTMTQLKLTKGEQQVLDAYLLVGTMHERSWRAPCATIFASPHKILKTTPDCNQRSNWRWMSHSMNSHA
jgi:hypothetical protein